VEPFRVTEAERGTRLDRLLCARWGFSRAQARRAIAEGALRVNGRPAAKGASLSVGDEVCFVGEPQQHAGGVQWSCLPDPDVPCRVRYEDEQLLVVDKPAGIACHPLRSSERGCVANWLVSRYPEMSSFGYDGRQAGLVNRLDNDTSGLLLAARSPAAFEALRQDLQQGRIEKEYLALVSTPLVAPQQIELGIAPDPSGSRRVVASTGPKAYRARVDIEGSEIRGRYWLVRIKVSTAYRHQIRVLLASIGSPIVGDTLYGGEMHEGLRQHLLHASALRLTHPVARDELVSIASPLPDHWPA
jgi:23S rRNA pseudouridine1911/1915/1917 synthase